MPDSRSSRSEHALQWAQARLDFYEGAATFEYLDRDAPIEYWAALELLRSAKDKRGRPVCEAQCRREQCQVKGSCAFQPAAALSEQGTREPAAWHYFNKVNGTSIFTSQPPDRVDYQHWKREDYKITPLYER